MNEYAISKKTRNIELLGVRFVVLQSVIKCHWIQIISSRAFATETMLL